METTSHKLSRRQFIKKSGALAASGFLNKPEIKHKSKELLPLGPQKEFTVDSNFGDYSILKDSRGEERIFGIRDGFFGFYNFATKEWNQITESDQYAAQVNPDSGKVEFVVSKTEDHQNYIYWAELDTDSDKTEFHKIENDGFKVDKLGFSFGELNGKTVRIVTALREVTKTEEPSRKIAVVMNDILDPNTSLGFRWRSAQKDIEALKEINNVEIVANKDMVCLLLRGIDENGSNKAWLTPGSIEGADDWRTIYYWHSYLSVGLDYDLPLDKVTMKMDEPGVVRMICYNGSWTDLVYTFSVAQQSRIEKVLGIENTNIKRLPEKNITPLSTDRSIPYNDFVINIAVSSYLGCSPPDTNFFEPVKLGNRKYGLYLYNGILYVFKEFLPLYFTQENTFKLTNEEVISFNANKEAESIGISFLIKDGEGHKKVVQQSFGCKGFLNRVMMPGVFAQ